MLLMRASRDTLHGSWIGLAGHDGGVTRGFVHTWQVPSNKGELPAPLNQAAALFPAHLQSAILG
jgi:hypothetical protein